MIKAIFILLFIITQNIFCQQQSVQPFLEDVISQFPNLRDLTISAAEDEAYFSAQSPLGEISVIMKVIKKDGKWSDPAIASFSGKNNDLEPFLSWDGLRLYFASDRLSSDTDDKNDYDIWYVERNTENSKWSDPINMGAPINSEHNEFYPSVAKNGNIYITSDAPTSKGKDDIYFSKKNNKSYSNPISVSDSINTTGYEFNAFIAPDESYIIFTGYGYKDGLGSGDLYISYQSESGAWSKAQNMGEKINSKQMDYCPFIHSKTNTLYFTSRRSEVNAEHAAFNSLDELLDEINKYENGLSRIYKVPFNK